MRITPANAKRLYVNDPRAWAFAPGTDFMLNPGTTTALITSGTAGQVLSEFGWTTTALAYVAGSAADFLSSADSGVANYLQFTAASDLLDSPAIFGDYAHALAASWVLGYMPTTLNMECRAAFLVASNDEPSSGFGFVEDGGSFITASAADQLAGISSDGTTFCLRAGAAEDAGAAVDTLWHTWRIKVSSANVEWFMDGVSQGTVALTADEFPVSFGAGIVSAGSNTLALGPVRVWYA